MQAGKLRHRVSIERFTGTQDTTTFEVTEEWNVWQTVWADVRPLLGRERYQAQQVKADITHEVRIRYITGINQKDRINHAGRYLYIEAILNIDERDKEMRLLCREQGA